jgi:hypothetical protein
MEQLAAAILPRSPAVFPCRHNGRENLCDGDKAELVLGMTIARLQQLLFDRVGLDEPPRILLLLDFSGTGRRTSSTS